MTEAYRRAGVDLEASAKAVALIGDLASRARRPEVADEVGGFAGLFRIGGGSLLAAATDGVGTKLEIARETGRLDTVGIDLVAMCADDVVCTGAEPLFFLDYLAVGKVEPERVAAIVEGVAEGCRRAGCALLGGETAEHPGTMPADQFDLAGFCVGVGRRGVDARPIAGARGRRADRPGLQRAARQRVLPGAPGAAPAGTTRGPRRRSSPGERSADELLEPCAIYAPRVLALARGGLVHAAAHITGGGFPENLPRALPGDLGAEVERGAWPEHPVFALVQAAAGASDADMLAHVQHGARHGARGRAGRRRAGPRHGNRRLPHRARGAGAGVRIA